MHIKAAVREFVPLVATATLLLLTPDPANTGALTGPIYDQGLTAVIEDVRAMPTTAVPVAPPLARINVLRSAPDGSGRLFVCDLNGPLYAIQGATIQTYLDFRTFAKFKRRPGLATGLVSFAFHPDFATNGLFYTVHTESVGTTPPNLVPAVSLPIVHHAILKEWHATNPAANTFSGTSRELMRIAAINVYHNLGVIDFNPNAAPGDADYGLLYIGQGDYGSTDAGHPEETQRLDTVYGCILRIDPFGGPFVRGGITFNYGIPPGNPFVSTPGAFGEIYTYGHRNAHRLQWDIGHNETMFTTDIGGNNIEEINRLVPGRNYGWPYREGAYAIDPVVNWRQTLPLPANDSTFHYTYPVAQFDHDPVLFPVHGTDTQCGIAGGVAYRAAAIPGLQGKFIFGDIVTGQMFYCYIDQLEAADDGNPATTAPVYKLHLQYHGASKTLIELVNAAIGSTSNYRTDLRFAMDAAGALYVTTKVDGMIRRLTSAFVSGTGVGESRAPLQASIFPNPVRPESVLRFFTARAGDVRADVFDAGGRRIGTVLNDRDAPAGLHEAPLPGTKPGARLRAGVYFARIKTGDGTSLRRFVVLE